MAEQPTQPVDAMDELASALGHVAIAWGTLQDALGHLFSAVLYDGSISEIALASWHSIQSDRAQRDMLAAAAPVALAHREDGLGDRIATLANKVNGMSDHRNDLIHASYATLTTTDGSVSAIPHTYYGNYRATKLAKRLAEGSLLDEIKGFHAKVVKITAECDEAFQCVVDPER